MKADLADIVLRKLQTIIILVYCKKSWRKKKRFDHRAADEYEPMSPLLNVCLRLIVLSLSTPNEYKTFQKAQIIFLNIWLVFFSLLLYFIAFVVIFYHFI